MARALRVEFPGAIYHVTSRMLGDWKKEFNLLFEDDRDRIRFLDRLGERVEEFEIRLYLFTLMNNHFHLVLETPQANLGRFMHSLSTAYTVYFNRRHERHGHLMDGRYKAKLVEGDEHLLALTRYVHLNPVRTKAMKRKPMAEKIDHLRRYRWSSYPGYIGRRKAYEFVQVHPILALMGCKKKEQTQRYRQYVESGLAESDEELEQAMIASPLCIGSEEFRERIQRLYHKLSRKHKKREDVSFRRIISPLKTKEVLETLADVFGTEVEAFGQRRRDSPLRGVAAKMLCRYSGLSQRQVAEALDMGSGSAVSRQLAGLGRRIQAERGLRKLVELSEARLEGMRQDNRK